MSNANPLEVVLSWNSFLLAVVIVAVVQVAKSSFDALLLFRHRNDTDKSGKELRAEIALVNKVVLPALPLFLGAGLGAFVGPIRPESLVEYVNSHGGGRVTFALWGVVVGQFADYLYQRAKRVLVASDPTRSSKTPTPPSPPAGGDSGAATGT